ncbi:MAG: hypothetical protein FJZ38_19220, partial [Candidatus Rokubacteria bacterium]|nr:hypothetical protein [Candidatus Rokubacteria bacterium]
MRIDDGDVADLLVQELRALRALEAELDVLRGERVAVVEADALAELELVDELIRRERPRLGEARHAEVPGHRFDDGVVDGVE